MYKHHEETIKNILEKLKVKDEVLGILLTGSIAHGFETSKSDVDIMIIVSEKDYKKRTEIKELTYWENESCTYEEGYIDGKYVSVDFMEKVAMIGSEPARFAFDGAVILYSKIEGLKELLEKITKYPIQKKEENIERFFAQLEGWKWFSKEAIKHNNKYLLNHSISNLVLFGGRLILAYNEILYPYHKWFIKRIEKANEKPEDIMEIINDVLSKKDKESIERFYECIINFTDWNVKQPSWTSQFVSDSELNWLNGNTPICDI